MNLTQFQKNQLLYMSCSSARFTSVIEKYERKKDIIKKDTVFVCGYSRKN